MPSIHETHASKNGADKTKKTDHPSQAASKTISILKEIKQCAKEREWKR